ncbi:flagellar biosynthesis protein FlhG [Paraburkholderia sp. BL6665CI2N2]|uniref:MinD/ParA family ATP-binding protein n=1 Tax=Paraburkholderia sp. BL6665CI2N2 TaxID=1938806 RepID=UPI001066AF91|nr:MinD/ParA family protein [Paraburkholderia sp. BL6665CI2N2]TDY27142.1 flagellar biosynthesis protein FlhG [Paraburkholderia sp. BL6665CI2N2]
MKDTVSGQALALCQTFAKNTARVVAVTGGSERSGCTAAVVHLAIALVKQGMDVLVVDECLGDGSASAVLGGIRAAGRIASVPNGRLPHVLPVSNSRSPIAITGPGHRNEQCYGVIEYDAAPATAPDVVLIDAALSDDGALSPLASQAHDVVIVTTMTADAAANTYVRMKRLHLTQGIAQFRIVMNRVENQADAQAVLKSISGAARDYLATSVLDGGYIRADPCIARASELPCAIAGALSPSPAAEDFARLATDLQSWPRRPAGSWREPMSMLPSSPRARGAASPFMNAQPLALAQVASKTVYRIYKPRFG